MKLSLRSILPARDLGWNRVRAACALPECHNKLLTKYVPGSRIGIFVGESWYCSPDCFALGSRKTLATFSSGCVVEMPRNPRLSLGLALVSKGLITEDQYREAVIRSQCRAETLETTLLECGYVSEKKLAAGRAAQCGYPALVQELSGPIVEVDLPSSLLRAHRAAPIHYSAKSKRLVLGFVDRVEHGLLQSIEQITGCRAEPCFITPAEFAEQMERVTALPEYEEVVVTESESATQMGRTLGGWAVEISAREASFAKCNSFAWVRMTGKRGTVDIVFSLKHASAAANTKLSAIVPEVTVNLG
jgi:hypothetical protein